MNKEQSPRTGHLKRTPRVVEIAEAKRPTIIVSDLSLIEKVHDEPIAVEVIVGGQPFKFEGRRLNPAQDNEVKGWLNRALPPRIPAAKEGEEDRYDLDDPEYRASRDKCQRTARALAIWHGFGVFKEEYEKKETFNIQHSTPNIQPTVEQILTFIESRSLEDEVLEILFATLTVSLVKVGELTGFISGSNSPKS